MLKHTRNLLLCGIKIESRTKPFMSYLGVSISEAFLKSVSIDILPICMVTGNGSSGFLEEFQE